MTSGSRGWSAAILGKVLLKPSTMADVRDSTIPEEHRVTRVRPCHMRICALKGRQDNGSLKTGGISTTSFERRTKMRQRIPDPSIPSWQTSSDWSRLTPG